MVDDDTVDKFMMEHNQIDLSCNLTDENLWRHISINDSRAIQIILRLNFVRSSASHTVQQFFLSNL